ncbi:MAG: hypothetical protein ACREAT_04750 [Nitrosotalea sp.]
MNSERMLEDVVAVIVEKVLMEMGIMRYTKASEMLADHNFTFSDCYSNPEVLNFILKELFGNAYLVVVDKIKNELIGLSDDNNQNLGKFIQKLSEG